MDIRCENYLPKDFYCDDRAIHRRGTGALQVLLHCLKSQDGEKKKRSWKSSREEEVKCQSRWGTCTPTAGAVTSTYNSSSSSSSTTAGRGFDCTEGSPPSSTPCIDSGRNLSQILASRFLCSVAAILFCLSRVGGRGGGGGGGGRLALFEAGSSDFSCPIVNVSGCARKCFWLFIPRIGGITKRELLRAGIDSAGIDSVVAWLCGKARVNSSLVGTDPVAAWLDPRPCLAEEGIGRLCCVGARVKASPTSLMF